MLRSVFFYGGGRDFCIIMAGRPRFVLFYGTTKSPGARPLCLRLMWVCRAG
jgi:hypothetical protein